ncbi:MAG: phosphoglucosamine mutase [Pirellulales bacterium]
MEPIISVSGLRGIVGQSLTPEIAGRYAAAFAAELPPGPLVLTRDGRTTGPMVASALQAALCAVGRDVIDAGVAATPTTGVLVRQAQAAGGLQISASHNPPEYNGLKLFSAEGRVVPAGFGQRVVARYRQGSPGWVSHERLGAARAWPGDTTSRHLELVLALVDVERIRRRKFRVLLDATHGAGSLLGARLLESLGCQATILGGDPNGLFEHPPEPTAENLSGVTKSTLAAKADVGFCQDPDADRLALIDETGGYVGEEYTLALCADHWLARHPGPVVINCSSSRMTEDLAARHKCPSYRSAVGEANVVDEMLRRGAVLGGEGNGGVIHPQVGLVRDSFVAMALVLDALAAGRGALNAWVNSLPRYGIAKTKFTLPAERVAAALLALEKRFPDAQADRLDGLRLDWPGRWLLVRASNTEPIVRAIAEAETEAAALELCRAAGKVLTAAEIS